MKRIKAGFKAPATPSWPWDPDCFIGREEFKKNVDAYIETIKKRQSPAHRRNPGPRGAGIPHGAEVPKGGNPSRSQHGKRIDCVEGFPWNPFPFLIVDRGFTTGRRAKDGVFGNRASFRRSVDLISSCKARVTASFFVSTPRPLHCLPAGSLRPMSTKVSSIPPSLSINRADGYI